MAYDETLADRLRTLVFAEPEAAERKMFGGLCFLVSGRMCCGVLGRDLVLRVSPERAPEVLRLPHVRPMDFTGRPMKGFVYVGPAATRDARALRRWVAEGVAYARSLPPAAARRARRPRPRKGIARSGRA